MSFVGAIRETFTTRTLRDELPPSGLLDRIAGFGLVSAAVLYLYFDVFSGMLRAFFGSIGLAPVTYLPAAVAFASLTVNALARIGDPRTAVPILCVVGFMVIELAISVMLGRSFAAALFGWYIWMPAFVAMALTQRRMQNRFIMAMIPMFYIATFGVLLNIFVHFPWVGATYEVMGFQQSAAREWTAAGQSRLGGFSRASFTAASHILLAYCVVEHRMKSLVWRGIWWAIGLVAIHYTTSKAPELAMLLLPATYFLVGRMRDTGGAQRQWLANALMAFWVLLIFAGPFISLMFRDQLYPDGPGVGRAYSSLADRVVNTWPNALAMVNWHDPVSWLVGRGLGGIGTPQMIFEPPGNPADNLAIYLFVMFGVFSLGIAYLIYRGAQRAVASGTRGRRDFVLIIAMLGIGTAANVVEGAVPAMVLGLAIARYKTRARAPSADRSKPERRRRSRVPVSGAGEPVLEQRD